jgi:putative transposase
MSLITRSYRRRVYPNGAQRRLLECWFGATRWLWNTALEIRSEAFRTCGLSLTGNDLSRWLTQWKRTTGHEWLAEVPATALTRCLQDQDQAFSRFFARHAGYPRFKAKGARQSLRFQGVGASWRCGVLRLPKLGVLKLAETLPEIERPDTLSLVRDASGAYYVSFCAELPCPLRPGTGALVGVDLGVTHLATLSTGEKIPNPRHYQRRLRYLRQQQRCLARRQKRSRRREKQRVRVARAHARVREARQYALHALTTRLVKEFSVIAIEDLNVKALGRGRAARAIQDAAFGELRRQLRYKSEWYGPLLLEADRWYASTKHCSVCRFRLDVLRLDQRHWRCPKCGSCHDRDINAARNLLTQGVCQLAGRDDRDLCVDAGDACPEEQLLVQVLAEEARSGHRNRASPEPVRLG